MDRPGSARPRCCAASWPAPTPTRQFGPGRRRPRLRWPGGCSAGSSTAWNNCPGRHAGCEPRSLRVWTQRRRGRARQRYCASSPAGPPPWSWSWTTSSGPIKRLPKALRLAFGRLGQVRVLLVVAGRQREAGSWQEGWRRLLATDDRVSLVALDGLSTPEVRQLAACHGRAIGLAAGKRLRQHTDGNPAHVNELIGQLEPAALASDRGTLPAPRSVGASVTACLAGCSPAMRELVGAAAVLCRPAGGGVSLPQVAVLADLDAALDPLAEAVTAGFLAEKPGGAQVEVGFPDNLVAAAVYDGLSLARRATLHARAADLSSGVLRLDHQVAAVRGCGGQHHRLVAELQALAQDEAASGTLARAARHLDQASQLSEDMPKRCQLLLDAAELLLASGDAAGSQARIDEAKRTGSGPRIDLLAGQHAMLVGRPDTAHHRLAAA